MSPLVKKEIRLLLPAWTAAMLLAIAPAWIIQYFFAYQGGVDDVPPPFFIMLGMLFLGVDSFGQEFSFKTFSSLLSQPVTRTRIWWIKISVLAIAFVSTLVGALVSWDLFVDWHPAYSSHFLSAFNAMPLWMLVFFGGGLWATLLLRQVTGAFWFSLLVPATIFVFVTELTEHFNCSQKNADYILGFVFATYSIAGFFWARRLFLRAQDVAWTGGTITLPAWRFFGARIASRAESRRRGPLAALLRKELQLHQANILIAVMVLALHLASVVIRKIHPSFENPNVKFILEMVWALWLLMPLLIGSAAIAEERRLGVVESQLCLPLSRRTQFFAKFSVALVLSLVLGGAMPFVIEKTRDFNHWIFVVCAVIFFISFYASSLARATLQAIGLAIVVAAAICFNQVATAFGIFEFGHSLSPEHFGLWWLNLYLGFPVLLLVLLCLMFWNFKWLHEDWKLWRHNFITVLAALAAISILSHAIYFRVWEVFMPPEVQHGPARLNSSEPPKLLVDDEAISALLPDGRLWTEQINVSGFGRVLPHLNTQRFVGGSNWVDAASDSYRIVGIQLDGSLWSAQVYPGYPGNPAYPLTRIGSGTNWLQVAGGFGFLLLKEDGTLWNWGTSGNTLDAGKLRRYLTTPPKRVGEGTNWTEVFGRFARRSDGSVWALSFGADGTNSARKLVQMLPWELPNKGFVSYAYSTGVWTVGVKTNGELWLFEYQTDQKTKEIQLGQNAKWKAAEFAVDNLIALRSDGTLWEWPPFGGLTRNSGSVKPVQLGTYSGWIALHSHTWPPVSVALAADGRLWVWNDPSEHIWLAPSRKPVFLGNIFGEAD